MSKILKSKHALAGLAKFKPVLAQCHQGQRRPGVNDGALYIYNDCFKHICDNTPFVVQNE